MKKRRVIKNADNRHTINQMIINGRLARVEYYISKLMEGQMMSESHLQGIVNNVNVALEKLAKKAKESEVE